MRRTYRTLYALGTTPWDRADIPPPLAAVVDGPLSRPAGKAVDLGCGTGRQARYLADHGWSVTAVDYIPTAVAAARRRDPDNRVTWRVADVTEAAAVDPTGDLAGTVSLILDNGCLHGIPEHLEPRAVTVEVLAAPGADLLIRAVRRQRRGIGPHGIDPADLTALLGPRWRDQPTSTPDWFRYTATAAITRQPPGPAAGTTTRHEGREPR